MVHYTGGKTNTDFWKYVTYDKPISDKVSDILNLSKTRLTRWDDFDTYYGCVNQIVWNTTLAGLGHFKRNHRKVFHLGIVRRNVGERIRTTHFGNEKF